MGSFRARFLTHPPSSQAMPRPEISQVEFSHFQANILVLRILRFLWSDQRFPGFSTGSQGGWGKAQVNRHRLDLAPRAQFFPYQAAKSMHGRRGSGRFFARCPSPAVLRARNPHDLLLAFGQAPGTRPRRKKPPYGPDVLITRC